MLLLQELEVNPHIGVTFKYLEVVISGKPFSFRVLAILITRGEKN